MTKKAVHEETMCCGHRRCPAVTLYDDGSLDVREDDGRLISFDPDQAARLRQLLNDKK